MPCDAKRCAITQRESPSTCPPRLFSPLFVISARFALGWSGHSSTHPGTQFIHALATAVGRNALRASSVQPHDLLRPWEWWLFKPVLGSDRRWHKTTAKIVATSALEKRGALLGRGKRDEHIGLQSYIGSLPWPFLHVPATRDVDRYQRDTRIAHGRQNGVERRAHGARKGKLCGSRERDRPINKIVG